MVRICFVCLGNICRSPTAEGVMARLVREAGLEGRIRIDSAGTGAWHVGSPPDPRTCAAAARRGVALDELRARQFTGADFAQFDLVLVMDRDNLRDVTRLPGAAGADIRLLRSFDPEAPADAEVPDPYAGGAAGFERVLDQCERACAGVIAWARERL